MKNYKGIIMCGGQGSRVKPFSNILSKHWIPIHDKPMIYYSLSVLMLAKIREIFFIADRENIKFYKRFFSNGNWLGLKINYIIQKKPLGISNGIQLASKFIYKSNICLILGDNFFYGSDLTKNLNIAKNNKCTFFTYEVSNPNDYGVFVKAKNKIFEKPKNYMGNKIVPGLYFFPNSSLKISKKLKISNRKEYEITDLINVYLKKKQYKVYNLKRGINWVDLGNYEKITETSSFISTIEKRNSNKIACLEEISLKNKWIKKIDIKSSLKRYGHTPYFNYIKTLI